MMKNFKDNNRSDFPGSVLGDLVITLIAIVSIFFCILIFILYGSNFIDIKWKEYNPIECIDGTQYRVNKKTGEIVEIVIKDGLSVKCDSKKE